MKWAGWGEAAVAGGASWLENTCPGCASPECDPRREGVGTYKAFCPEERQRFPTGKIHATLNYNTTHLRIQNNLGT